MATATEIVGSTSGLVDALNNLVETDTFEAVIEVARAVGAQEQINSGVDALVALLNEISQGLEELREPLTHLEALSGLIDIIAPLIESISQAGGQAAQELEGIGLAGIDEVIGPVLEVGPQSLEFASGFLEAAPSLDSVTNLQREISEFIVALENYKDNGSNGSTDGDSAGDT